MCTRGTGLELPNGGGGVTQGVREGQVELGEDATDGGAVMDGVAQREGQLAFKGRTCVDCGLGGRRHERDGEAWRDFRERTAEASDGVCELAERGRQVALDGCSALSEVVVDDGHALVEGVGGSEEGCDVVEHVADVTAECRAHQGRASRRAVLVLCAAAQRSVQIDQDGVQRPGEGGGGKTRRDRSRRAVGGSSTLWWIGLRNIHTALGERKGLGW